MKTDLHLHSHLSHDGAGTVEEICRSALEEGLRAIAVTDHLDYFYHKAPEGSDFQALKQEILQCRQRFAPNLEVLLGIEIGQIHRSPEAASELCQALGFDFVLGSIHAPGGDADVYDMIFRDEDLPEFFQGYLSEACQMIRGGGFDSFAHLDYPLRKMGHLRPSLTDYLDAIDPLLQALVDGGIALEINGRGVTNWVGSAGPSLEILRRYRQLGGELITTGSDGHSPAAVATGIASAEALAREAGFSHVTLYRQRQPHMIPLD